MTESFYLKAVENLEAAKLLYDNGLNNASANRAYYAVFHISIAAIYK